MRHWFAVIFLGFIGVMGLDSCSVNYGFTGGDFSGAETFEVAFLKPTAPLASQQFALNITESLKDLIQSQSPLDLVERDGQLVFSGAITGYKIAPVSVQSNEQASLNRLTVTIKLRYENNVESDKSFDRTFEEYAEYDSNTDFFAIEEELWEEVVEKLTQSIYNASLGNW